MGILSKVAEFVGGDVFKSAKDLITEYWPPDVSPEKRAELDIKLAELAAQKAREAGELANAQLALELQDTQQARTAHQHSIMPAIVTILLTIMCSGLLYAVIYVDIKAGGKEIALTLFGSTFALWSAAIQYWVGTTRGSQEKDRVMLGK